MSMIDLARWWLAENKGCWCVVCRHGHWQRQLSKESGFPDDLVLYHRVAGLVQPDFDVGAANVGDLSLRCLYCSGQKGIVSSSYTAIRKPKKMNHGQLGWAWMNNGTENKLVKPEDQGNMEGWKKGRIISTRPPNHTGGVRITNGVVNRIIRPDETIPEGWWKGRAKYWKKGIQYGLLARRTG
jgi:hypothetical protein